MKQIYYEDVEVGTELPALVKETSVEQSARWAGTNMDYSPYHYNREAAKSLQLPDIIVNGHLKVTFLAQLVTDWIGGRGVLRRLECQHRGMNIVGETLTCRGRVVKKSKSGDENTVECEIWIENPEGERGTFGSAIVILPSKGPSPPE
jgi:acyl dehydratase